MGFAPWGIGVALAPVAVAATLLSVSPVFGLLIDAFAHRQPVTLRGVVGTLTVDELIKDRDKFRQQVLGEAGDDLTRLGMQIDVFNPQSITDEQGYINALASGARLVECECGQKKPFQQARRSSGHLG